jgi:hypothetical protein
VRDITDAIREACAWVATRARHVRIDHDALAGYAASLPLEKQRPPPSPAEREPLVAFWLTLDAINFGSGWYPTLRKRPGRSGYHTIAEGVRERFERAGPWSADELALIDRVQIAAVLGQDPEHELMELFARSLSDLGSRLATDHGGRFDGPLERAGTSAVKLAELLGGWSCFADSSTYEGRVVPFLKRAQIAAADLHRAGAARFTDVERLTMFADNLVPHVLRLDGVLGFAPALAEAIERQSLIEHGSLEEVEIRACAVHAVELIVGARPDTCAADVDQVLWERGSGARYKASPRHRCRCTAY